MIPIQIKIKNQNYLSIVWDENHKSLIKLSDLRRECPCAYCMKEKENDHGKFEIYTNDQIKVKEIVPIGTYAIQIAWNDDHSSGIYEYSYLKKIAENDLD